MISNVFVGVSIAILLTTPFYRQLGISLRLCDWIVVRILLVVLCIVATTYGPLPGSFTTLAVLNLFFERNRQRFAAILPRETNLLVQGTTAPPLTQPSANSYSYSPTENEEVEDVSVEHDTSMMEDLHYESAPEASGLDTKQVLGEAPKADDAPSFFEQKGLA